MQKDVKKFVSSCATCQQTKYLARAPLGLLQATTPLTAVWEDIGMDFITNLPAYNGHSVIMVVVDRFSKSAHFGALPAKFSTYQVAELFVK